VVLIVLVHHPSKNGMMLPNASINFGVRNSTPNLIHADGSCSTTNQSLPFSLPIFPGPVLMKSMAMENPRCTWLAGWDHLQEAILSKEPSNHPSLTNQHPV